MVAYSTFKKPSAPNKVHFVFLITATCQIAPFSSLFCLFTFLPLKLDGGPSVTCNACHVFFFFFCFIPQTEKPTVSIRKWQTGAGDRSTGDGVAGGYGSWPRQGPPISVQPQSVVHSNELHQFRAPLPRNCLFSFVIQFAPTHFKA